MRIPNSIKLAIIGFISLIVFGCATVPKTPQQTIYQIKSEYQIALAAAVTYKNLPACGTPNAPLVCSDPKVVAKLQAADAVAGPAIQAAENTVLDPNFDSNTANAVVIAAQQALLLLTAITAQVQTGSTK